jgi:hypothetical protein
VKWFEIKEHFLSDKHQILLIEFICQYIFSKKPHSDRSITRSSRLIQTQREITAIEESIVILLSVIETLSNDSTRLKSEYDQTKLIYERTMSQMTQSKKMLNENAEKLVSYERWQDETDKEMNEAKKLFVIAKMLLLDIDGTITFSFNKFNPEMNSIFSSIFKTSPCGYSFILRLCSTNENQEYLSIFIALVRSDFDNILVYPFPYNISLCLYHQSGERKHIVSTLIADPKSPSFVRPTSERNDEIGITKFCPLNYLTDEQNAYVKDGVFFIRVFFDFMNTGLNPFH